MADDEVPGWHGRMRCDGARVAVDPYGGISVHAPLGHTFAPYRLTPALSRLDLCPCCDLPFMTLRAAQRVANELLPPPPNALRPPLRLLPAD